MYILSGASQICSCIVVATCTKCDRVRGNRAYVGEIDFETQAKTVGTISFVKVDFICLKFRVGIVESCQEV